MFELDLAAEVPLQGCVLICTAPGWRRLDIYLLVKVQLRAPTGSQDQNRIMSKTFTVFILLFKAHRMHQLVSKEPVCALGTGG